jgi:hypothetical protein
MPRQQQPKQGAKATTRSAERVRVICILNVDFCVYDGKVPVAIYSKRSDADLHRKRLLRQQAKA